MEAVYDMSRYPASFNFFEFLVTAKTRGATGIVLDDTKGYLGKYPPDLTRNRIDSIIEPGIALAGLPFRYGAQTPEMMDCGYHFSKVLLAYKELGHIAKLKTVKPPGTVPYTITLRNYKRHERRNSGREAWERFGREIGATIIEDWDDVPIHLHDRMALYAGAKMNFFVANGPAALCNFSDYPYTQFMKNVSKMYHSMVGWSSGSMPWANENQCSLFEDDTYQNITGAWPVKRAA